MPSYGGPVYSPRVQDKSADFIYQGAADLWGGIGKGLSDGIGKAVDEREKSKALQARFDMLADQGFATPELRDKFYKGSTGAQAGIMAELMARMDREQSKPQMATTPDGSRYYYNPKSGAITPGRTLEKPTVTNLPNPNGGPQIGMTNDGNTFTYPEADPVDMGEWREVPGVPDMLKHWTPKKGDTGALMKKTDAAGRPPQLGYVENPHIPGVGAFLDANGDVVDPAKLVTSEPIPGTEGPSKRMPMPFVPGMPPGMQFTVPGAPPKVRTRPYEPKDVPVKPTVINGAEGTVREWPDGRQEYLEWDENNVPIWRSMGPQSILLPPVQGSAPAPAAPATVPPYRWRKP